MAKDFSIISWNVNGVRAALKKGAMDFFADSKADVICLQEVASNHAELEGNASANQFRQLTGAFGGYQPVIEPTSAGMSVAAAMT